MKNISTKSMTEMLWGTKGATMMGAIAVTDPYNGNPLKSNRATGAINPFLCHDLPNGSALVKVQRGTGMFNVHYNKAVERRVSAAIIAEHKELGLVPPEGDDLKAAINDRFTKGANWQQAVVRPDGTMTPFAEHKTTGVLYLRTMFYRLVGDAVYVDVRDGRTYTFAEVQNVLPKKSPARNQGLDEEEQVRYNVWKLNGIRGLRFNGEAFRVRPPLEIEAEAVFTALNKFLVQIEPPEPPTMKETTGED